MARAAAMTVDVTAGDALARVADDLNNDEHSAFIGYDSLFSRESKVLAIVNPKTGEMLECAREGDEVDVLGGDASLFEAEPDRFGRKARVVLLAREPLLLGSRDDLAVAEQRGG